MFARVKQKVTATHFHSKLSTLTAQNRRVSHTRCFCCLRLNFTIAMTLTGYQGSQCRTCQHTVDWTAHAHTCTWGRTGLPVSQAHILHLAQPAALLLPSLCDIMQSPNFFIRNSAYASSTILFSYIEWRTRWNNVEMVCVRNQNRSGCVEWFEPGLPASHVACEINDAGRQIEAFGPGYQRQQNVCT